MIPKWGQTGKQYIDVLASYARDAGYIEVTRDNLRHHDIVYIIDEAQSSYHDVGLWVGFIKSLSGSHYGPRVCLFSSYGSPEQGPDDDDYGATTPVRFGPHQRVSITQSRLDFSPPVSLFYSRSEFDDVSKRKCGDPRRPLPLSPDATEYIFHLTNGHPGAVEGVLEMVEKVCCLYSVLIH